MDSGILTKRIMRRVYVIWFLKTVLSPRVLKVVILLGLLKGSFELVHVRSVFANAPSFFDPAAIYQFSISAFANTEFAVQAVILGIIAFSFWLAKDILRTFATSSKVPA